MHAFLIESGGLFAGILKDARGFEATIGWLAVRSPVYDCSMIERSGLMGVKLAEAKEACVENDVQLETEEVFDAGGARIESERA